MHFSRKILIVIVILIASCILYMLIKERKSILAKEGFFNVFKTQETIIEQEFVNTQDLKNKTTLSNVKEKDQGKKLADFFIKSSYNTSATGYYVNRKMLKYVLSRGCRFIDLEVFSSSDKYNGLPFVAYANEKEPLSFDSKNSFLLNDALQTIRANAFQEPSPNPKDPLFIHLRIHAGNNDLYKVIGQLISNTFGDKLSTCDINMDTLVSEVMGKAIIVVDLVSAPDYKDYTTCTGKDTLNTCVDLIMTVNLESGGDYLRVYNYSDILNLAIVPPYIYTDGSTDIETYRLVVPNFGKTTTNPNAYDYVINYGTQFLALPFNINDKNLEEYEEIFNKYGSAFVPMSETINHLKQKKLFE